MCYIIVSDIHANYTALKAVMDATERIAATKKFYFLGDLLGYGPTTQAIDCIDWLRYESHIYHDNGGDELRWVPGNHDEWAVTQLGRVRPEGSVTLLAQRAALEHARSTDWEWFATEVRAALSEDPRSLLIKSRDAGSEEIFMAFTHGGILLDERRGTYLRPWLQTVLNAHFTSLRSMTDAKTRILFSGHTHLPYLAQILPDERHSVVVKSIKYGAPISLGPGDWIVNPGSVGHPRDGDPRAAFVLFDPDTRTVEFRRVDYDIRRVVDALRQEQFSSQTQHEVAARYLIKLDAPKPATEQDEEIDLENLPRSLLRKYQKQIEKVYDHLIHEIETGDGGEEMQNYRKVYRMPQWDLEAMGDELAQ